MKRSLVAVVFLAACLVFGFNLWSVNIASGWIDPVLRFGAQDEATYTHEAIQMLTSGDWVTPTLMGRWIFEKPPFLVWLSAASMKVFGIGGFSARLPALLAGAFIAALCFKIARDAVSLWAGVLAALLSFSNQLLFTMARHAMTDILLTACLVAVLAILAADPGLLRRHSRCLFAVAIAAGILTKSIAGILPAAGAFLFALAARENRWERVRRTTLPTALGVALAAPWFLYHLVVHRDWFLADLGFQLVTVGVVAHQTSPEHHVLFYLVRLLYAAPLAVVLAFTGIPGLLSGLRNRKTEPVLLASFFLVLASALLVFRFHSQQYLTPMMPVLVLLAATTSPLARGRVAVAAIAVILVAFAVKAANPREKWGISYESGSTVALAQPLQRYCEERRDRDLYIAGVNDEFYALALPIDRVRYGWIDPADLIAQTRPYLAYLGVVQRVAGGPSRDVFLKRLRTWGFPSGKPLGTAMTARTAPDFAAFIAAHPESDFIVSLEIAELVPPGDQHQRGESGAGYILLKSPTARPAPHGQWTCRM